MEVGPGEGMQDRGGEGGQVQGRRLEGCRERGQRSEWGMDVWGEAMHSAHAIKASDLPVHLAASQRSHCSRIRLRQRPPFARPAP